MSEENTKKSFSERMSYIGECLKARDFKNPALRPAKIFLLSLLVLIVLIVLLLIIRVRHIEVTGDLSVFSEAQVVEAAELDFGDGMYTSLGIRRAIKDKLPLVDSVSVRRNPFTGRLTINIRLKRYEYFVSYGGRFYAVDDELRVLDIRDSRLELISLGARPLTLPKIEEPVLGECLIFTATVDILNDKGKVEVEGVSEERFDYARRMLSFVSDGEYFERVNAVLLDEKFNVKLILDGKYLVRIGKCDSLETKLEVVDAIIAEGSVTRGLAAEIDVQDPALASARVDNTLDLDTLVKEREEKADSGKKKGSSESEDQTEGQTEGQTEFSTESESESA